MRAFVRRIVLSVMWGAVARRYRAEQPFVIAVTGSVGKTSTKEAIATVLEQGEAPVVKSLGNLATDTGIPLSLIGFDEQVKGRRSWLRVLTRALTIRFPKPTMKPYWVIEYSSDKPGDLAFLASRIPYDFIIYTSGGPVHLEYYGGQEQVMAELKDMLRFAHEGAPVVINGDDPFLTKESWPKGTHAYSVAGAPTSARSADLVATIGKLGPRGMSVTFRFSAKHGFSAPVAVVGRQQLMPVVGAVLTGSLCGLSDSVLVSGVKAYAVPAGRGRLIEGKKDVTIVDDTANASPEAAVAGLAMLKTWGKGKRTVAVLGTMNELGDYALEAHEEVAAAAAKTVSFLVAVGPFADAMREAAVKAGMPSHHVLTFSTPEHLFTQVGQIVERGDIMYVKASQNGMRLERLVKMLMAHPEQAPHLLVRQSNAWKE